MFLIKKLISVNKIKYLLKMSMFLQTALAAETHMAVGPTLKL
jgi:hypothetical protein